MCLPGCEPEAWWCLRRVVAISLPLPATCSLAGWQELFALLYSSLPLRQLRRLRLNYLPNAGLEIKGLVSPQSQPLWKSEKPPPASPPSPLVENYRSCQGAVLFDLTDQVGRARAGQVDMRSKVQALRVCEHRSPRCGCFL